MANSGNFNTSAYTFQGGTRYLTFEWSVVSQDIALNQTTISWRLVGAGTYKHAPVVSDVHVVIDGEVVYDVDENTHANVYVGTVVASGTTVIKHTSDGSKTFSASAECGIYVWAANCSGSGSWSLPSIPRKSGLEVPNGTLGVLQAVTVAKAASGFTHTITYNSGVVSGTICTKSSDIYVNWVPPMDLALNNTTGTSVVVNFTIETFSGSTSVGTSTATAVYQIPSSVAPYMASTLSDPTGWYDIIGAFVQGQSKLQLNINAQGSYGASIASITTIFDGGTYSGESVTTNTILQSGNVTASITAKDSRGRTVEERPTISVLAYSYPKLTEVRSYRSDASGNANANGSYITVKFSSSVTSLNSKNGAWYKVQYKKSTASAYTTVDLTSYTGNFAVTNGTYTFSADETSYDINVLVGDRFKTIPYSVPGASVEHTISMLKKNGKVVGIAFGKLAEHEGVFDIGWTPKFSGGGDVVVEEGETNGWTWRKWDSGVAECWKTLEHSTTVATQWGSMYVGNATKRQNYPFTFVAKPTEIVSITSGSKMGFLYPEQSGYGVNGVSASAQYNVASLSSYTTAVTYYFNYHVMGRWK